MYYFHKKLKIKKPKNPFLVGFFRWFFLGGFFIANPAWTGVVGTLLAAFLRVKSTAFRRLTPATALPPPPPPGVFLTFSTSSSSSSSSSSISSSSFLLFSFFFFDSLDSNSSSSAELRGRLRPLPVRFLADSSAAVPVPRMLRSRLILRRSFWISDRMICCL
jgi:hypothetical protein